MADMRDIHHLKPRECFALSIYSHIPGPFNVQSYCSSNPTDNIPYVFDAVIMDPHLSDPLPENKVL